MKKHRIGVDARLYFQTGIGVYLRNFVHWLQKQELHNTEIYLYVLANDVGRINIEHSHIQLRPVTASWHTFSEQISFLKDINKDKLDLMHFTYFSYPILYKRKFIATVHDITLLQEKTGKASTRNRLHYEIKHQVFKYVLSTQLKNATAIVTPTQTVKDQIVQLFGHQYESKIHPIYEGVDYELISSAEPPYMKQKVSEKYFLYVGNFYPHKNVDRLLLTFQKLKTPLQLVLVGPKNYFSEQTIATIKKLGLDEKIKVYLNAPTDNLVFFYRHASAFIFPSLAEGFGLPLIEAAHFGLPIVASDIPVFHELLQDGYLSFNPRSTEDIAAKIEDQLNHLHPLYKPENLERFSFQMMTEAILKLYMEVLR